MMKDNQEPSRRMRLSDIWRRQRRIGAVFPPGRQALRDAIHRAEPPHVRGGDEGHMIEFEAASAIQVRTVKPADPLVDALNGHLGRLPVWQLPMCGPAYRGFRNLLVMSPFRVRKKSYSSRVQQRHRPRPALRYFHRLRTGPNDLRHALSAESSHREDQRPRSGERCPLCVRSIPYHLLTAS